jgi:predicted metal-binding membrane protein
MAAISDHGDWTNAGLAASLCQSLPAGGWLLPLGLYAGGWLLMSAAMMLPPALLLLAGFRRMVARRADRSPQARRHWRPQNGIL